MGSQDGAGACKSGNPAVLPVRDFRIVCYFFHRVLEDFYEFNIIYALKVK